MFSSITHTHTRDYTYRGKYDSGCKHTEMHLITDANAAAAASTAGQGNASVVVEEPATPQWTDRDRPIGRVDICMIGFFFYFLFFCSRSRQL